MPAILKRPHPLATDAARPAQQLTERARRRRDRHVAKRPARRLVDRRKRVRTLVGVRTDHDHLHRPLVGIARTDPRWTHLSWGDATLLSSHARDPRTAAGDTTKEGQTNGRQHGKGSARRQPRTLPITPDTTASDKLRLSLTWKGGSGRSRLADSRCLAGCSRGRRGYGRRVGACDRGGQERCQVSFRWQMQRSTSIWIC
jgi:hypothetical protein